MAQYSASFRSSSNEALATGQPIVEIQSSITDYARVTRMEIELNVSFNSQNYAIGLGIPAAAGIIAGNGSFLFVPHNPSSAPCGVVAGVNWTTPPTAPVKFFRRASAQLPAATTSIPRIVFAFSGGLGLAPASSMVLWMIAGSGNPQNVAPLEIKIEIDA